MSNLCRIYEWRAKGTKRNQPTRVVYAGRTCNHGSRYGENFQNRTLGYSIHGNHKADLIDDALDRGYELQMRFKQAKNHEDARKQETKLLKKYDRLCVE